VWLSVRERLHRHCLSFRNDKCVYISYPRNLLTFVWHLRFLVAVVNSKLQTASLLVEAKSQSVGILSSAQFRNAREKAEKIGY